MDIYKAAMSEAEKIQSAGERAAKTGHKAVVETIEEALADGKDHQKVGAMVCAMTSLYACMLEAIIKSDDKDTAELGIGLALKMIDDRITKVGIMAAGAK